MRLKSKKNSEDYKKVGITFNGERYRWFGYNQSHIAGLCGLCAIRGRFLIINFVLRPRYYSPTNHSEVTTRKILLVGHSQGPL